MKYRWGQFYRWLMVIQLFYGKWKANHDSEMTKKESGNKVHWRTMKLHNQTGTEANDLILKEDGETIM